MTAIFGNVELVTTRMAKEWLGNVRNQAKRDPRLIRTYAGDMRSGRWKLNGEPIIVAASGQLLSGRLRLQACLEAECSFKSLVIRGVDDRYFETVDAVRRRTMADILTIRREPNGRALGAALGIIWRYGAGWNAKQSSPVSAQQLLAVLEANPEVRTSLLLSRASAPALPQGLAAAAHYLFSCADPHNANAFFATFQEEGDASVPPVRLRRALIEMMEQGGARNQTYIFAITIKAWEAYRSGKPLLQLKFAANEEFPKITSLPENLALDGGQVVRTDDPGALYSDDADAEVEVESVSVTPSMARSFLERNDGNRRIAPPVVQRYKRDMLAQNWQLNGQTIKFGKSGRLLDGQHRLAACIEADASFPALIVTGLDESVFDTFDLGARRSVADVLIDRGEINTSTLASTLRQLWLLKRGLLQVRVVTPSVAEMLELLESDPDVRQSVSMGGRIRDIAAPSLACALHYLFSRRDANLADEFIYRLGDGVALEARNPILVLRERLIRDRSSSRKRSMADAEKAALFIKAWNALRAGTEIQTLRWGTSGPKREAFPEIL